MAPPSKPATERRIPLTRERVLRAAVAFADESGIGPLSMRKLGEALGVEAMSHHPSPPLALAGHRQDLPDRGRERE